jgi:hypothetical protein
MAVWMAGCLCQALGQTEDSSLYSRLFQHADQPVAVLTDQEMQTVKTIAADCQAATEAFYRQHPAPSVFDALMESIETGQDNSEQVQQMEKDREDEAQRIRLRHIEQLRAALGDARFDALTTWLRAEEVAHPHAPRK